MKWCTKLDVAYRRGALLFLKVICQISRSHRTKNDHTKCQNQRSRPLRSNEIWPKSGRFQTITSLNPWMPIKCSKCYKFMGKRSITVVQHGHSNIFSILFADYRSDWQLCWQLIRRHIRKSWLVIHVFIILSKDDFSSANPSWTISAFSENMDGTFCVHRNWNPVLFRLC